MRASEQLNVHTVEWAYKMAVIYTYIYKYTYIHIYTYMYTYTYILVYIHIYTYTGKVCVSALGRARANS